MSVFNKLLDAVKMSDDFEQDGFLDDDFDEDEDEIKEEKPRKRFLKKLEEEDEAEELEEERRLFYVAMTRAKKKLFITYVKEKNGKSKTPSRFIDELLVTV